MLSGLYLDALRTLHKATGRTAPTATLRAVNAAHDRYEPRVLAAVNGILRRARTRFRRSLSVDRLSDLLGRIHKSDSEDDVKSELRRVFANSFAGADAVLVNALTPLIDELAQQFHSMHDVDINFRLVNRRAVDYLQTQAANLFSTLSDAQAQGLLSVVGDTLASDEGYTIRDVAASIRNEILNKVLAFPTDAGNRQIGIDEYSLMVARSETARAASSAQKAILADLDLKSWQWNSPESCCDDCDENADEIVLIGEPFPSGETEPPNHPNCRCIVTCVLDELDSLKDDDLENTDDSETDTNDS